MLCSHVQKVGEQSLPQKITMRQYGGRKRAVRVTPPPWTLRKKESVPLALTPSKSKQRRERNYLGVA